MKTSHLQSRILAAVVDTLLIVAAYVIAFLLRFDLETPRWGWVAVMQGVPMLLLTYWFSLFYHGTHLTLWRYVSTQDAIWVLRSMAFALGVQFILRGGFAAESYLWLRPPIGVAIMTAAFSLVALMAARIFVRWRYDRPCDATDQRILVFGAGRKGVALASELPVVAFLDDDPAKKGARLQGVFVVGGRKIVKGAAHRFQATDLLIAIETLSPDALREIVSLATQAKLKVSRVPKLADWQAGATVRPIDVADLLGRQEVSLDPTPVRAMLAGQTIVVTGAGGSIGSEIARQVLGAKPKTILLVEQSECALYQIERTLRKILDTQTLIVPFLADCGCELRMRQLFETYHPQIILHAAAYKHVPMIELNPCEAFRNNVMGSRRLGELAIEYGVDRFLLISTDKAVRPTSVMGLTKRLTEIVLRSLNGRGKTRFSMVRFGNVLDSSGSVVPLFREQIAAGGPVTVTDPEMTRYFMTTAEAVTLVLQATAYAQGGEIFILDMGNPIKIRELAEVMITLSGLRPDVDIPITYTGIRPGEKLFEELDISDKSVQRTDLKRIFIGKINPLTETQVAHYLDLCQQLASQSTPLTPDCVRETFADLCNL